jgi:hypothetical protein
MVKPKIFIASSSESLSVVRAISTDFEHDYEVTPWSSGNFRLSSTTISDLVMRSATTDFAVFVFQPDDLTESRGKQEHVVRDNVLFELGLFIGAIGVKRCFIVKPRDEELKLPSDLLGITLAEYDSQRSDDNFDAALFPACHKMRTAMKSQGTLNRISLGINEKVIVNPYEYQLNEAAIKVLAACLETHTKYPGGISSSSIIWSLKEMEEQIVTVQLIKLERMSLIERSLQIDNNNGDEFYAYAITDAGIDKLLENEAILSKPRLKHELQGAPIDFSDDIPF